MMHELIEQVTIHDPFWSSRLESNSTRAIFHQWEQLEASGCIDNFRIVASELDGFRQGWFFADSDAYKWLDAAARIYATAPGPTFKSTDGGVSWTAKTGPWDPNDTLQAVRFSPDWVHDGTAFVGCESSMPRTTGGVYKTTDRGETWTFVGSGLETVYDIEVSPSYATSPRDRIKNLS
jgi:photosystem II stability/assembly factor-like uncharacterized protein